MADKLKDLPEFYKNVNTSELKNAWIKILQDNPTNAIDAYHKALCKDNEKNGWCGLMNLFRILGALEEVKNQRDNPPNNQLLEDMNKNLQIKYDKLEKEKEERDNKEKKDLEKINELNSVFKELQRYIVSNMERINKGYSDVNGKVKEALKQLKNAEEETIREAELKKSDGTKKND